MQVEGLRQCGVSVALHAQRTVRDPRELDTALRQAYGVDLSAVHKVTGWSRSVCAVNLWIALRAFTCLLGQARKTAILSRNLYAAFLLGVVMRRPLIFETHQLESGWRRPLQARLLASQHIITVVISKRLTECLADYHGFRPVRTLVLHDAAPAGIVPLPREQRRARLIGIVPQAYGAWRQVCGYFGHLYAGRGVEVIEAMADSRPDVLFLVFGGNESDVTVRRLANSRSNLHYIGHVPHPVAQEAMRSMDVLLMPYQKRVSIGVAGQDTAQWMSPMKMFEYMASGVPLVSSDLPVLREVLEEGRNALLVAPGDPRAWVAAVDRLAFDPGFAAYLGANAHVDYQQLYTWAARARQLLEAAKELQFVRSSS